MDKLAPILQQLADKLGTTVDRMWPMLVERTRLMNQLQLNACRTIMVVLLAAFVLSLVVFVKRPGPNRTIWDFDDPVSGVCSVILGLLAGVTVIVFCVSYPGWMVGIRMPEAQTIVDILSCVER